MARRPMISIKHDTEGYHALSNELAEFVVRVSEDLQRFERYWKYVSEITICIAGPDQAYLHVAYATNCESLRGVNPYDGVFRRRGVERYWRFDQVWFHTGRWSRRINKALANKVDYQGFALELERRMRACWHQERFRFWDVIAGINAVLRKMTILGGYRLQIVATKIPKEGAPMPHCMDVRPPWSLNLKLWIDHPLGDWFMLSDRADHEMFLDRLAIEVAQQGYSSFADNMRQLIDYAKRIGALKKDAEAHKDEISLLEEQEEMIRRQLLAHLKARNQGSAEAPK